MKIRNKSIERHRSIKKYHKYDNIISRSVYNINFCQWPVFVKNYFDIYNTLQ